MNNMTLENKTNGSGMKPFGKGNEEPNRECYTGGQR